MEYGHEIRSMFVHCHLQITVLRGACVLELLWRWLSILSGGRGRVASWEGSDGGAVMRRGRASGPMPDHGPTIPVRSEFP